MNQQHEEPTYSIVVNDEEQYSYWPDSRSAPPGWRRLGTPGSKEECLSRIESLWTDMRPLSLRRLMEQTSGRTTADHD
jgi:MbtH protein